MNKKFGAHLALFAAQVIYATSFIIAKLVMPEYIKPFGFVLLRAVGAAVLFWVVSVFIAREKTENKDMPKLFLFSICGVVINQMLFLKGLSMTTPINAAIMMVTSPILVVIVASFIIKERITLLKITGIALGFAGAAGLMLEGGAGFNLASENMLGDLYVFINALSWGMYIVLVKPLMQKYKTVTVLKWTFLFGSLLVFPFGINELTEVNWEAMPFQIVMYASFIVVGTTFLAYLLNVYALNELSPSIVSAYIYLQPLLTALIALSFGQDQLSISKIVCALFIFAGVYLVSIPVKKEISINE